MTLRINFTRAENGKVAYATCETPTGVLRVGAEEKPMGGFAAGKGTYKAPPRNRIIYDMLSLLRQEGEYTGQEWEAHDGRLVCLTGVIQPVKETTNG
jgi:hypothetical protein